MLWGQWGRRFGNVEMAACIHQFLDNSISSFDHADIYGDYTTEMHFGSAFKDTGIARDKVQFISKCGIKLKSFNKNIRLNHYDYSENHIVESCHLSLKNLKTDYLDLFLLHRPSPLMQPEIIAGAITQLLESGKILSFGVSNFTNEQTEIIRSHLPVSYNQIEFSVSRHQPLTDGSLHYMMKHKVTPMAWAPLGGYFHSDHNSNNKLTATITRLAQQYNVDADHILLNWVIKHPSNILLVVGTTRSERISRLPLTFTFDLDDQEWFEIWTAAMGQDVP